MANVTRGVSATTPAAGSGGGGFDWMQFVNFIQNVSGKNQSQNWDDSSSMATDPATTLYKQGYFDKWFGWKTPRQKEEDRQRKMVENLAERRQKLSEDALAEEKRQNMAQTGIQTRQLGMAGLDRLAEARSAATKNARTMSFARDLAAASRMG